MKLTLSQAPRLKQSIRCRLCQTLDGHTDSCPTGVAEALETLKHRINCPECLASGSIEPNVRDLLECRNCRRQYTRADLDAPHPYPRRVLYSVQTGERFPALLLTELGDGKFPIVLAIEKANQAVREARAALRSRGRREPK